MPKNCNHKTCQNLVFGGGYCKFHQYLRNKPPKQAKPKKTIPRMTIKKQKESEKYSVLRVDFLKEHPLCEAKLEQCTRVATEVHHKKGRQGKQYCPLAA